MHSSSNSLHRPQALQCNCMELVMGIGSHLDSPSNSASNPNIRRNSRNMSVKVGEIQGHDVIYVPEKDVIFCKNTTLSFPLIERIIVKSSMDRTNIPDELCCYSL